ncbi:putative alkaline shock family protein YloU [Keratinibaculum paraultunense]|uniref:Putative alkaline shock family protein YloU n=1 Tax=Keratinibaculum paraultunense TaxID=1278232 RepID=A0A4R3L0D0_9FIRM|nr:alkaline shock response membrane anchor protein AmaP [Keratinibaculum paraultunense]QQY80615.1 alkaline shock response membrane anchor protein AmaP [Keratinibaculum paraultunense]TCS91345.1 putative alkaline shock family protein YloU [Keratinibaculum paraultunense]
MTIIDKILLFIFSLCIAILSLALVLFPFQPFDLLSRDSVQMLLDNMIGDYMYTLIGLIFFLISIRFIFVAIKGDKSKDKTTYLIQRTEHGEINISSDTIVGLVQSVADHFTGIRDIKTKVDIIEGQIFINLKGQVSPEINIPETTEDLQLKVKEHVENCTGVNVSEVKVLITNVATPIRNVK